MEQAIEVPTMQVMNIEDFAMGTESLLKQVKIIQDVMKSTMQEGQHYGLIPGCGDKPTLLKPGAEKLTMTFRFAPKFHVTERDLGKGHREYEVQTQLYSIVTSAFVGEGVGSCSTMESKYRFRKAEQICPECGQNAIIKGKKEYGGGWLCYKKKGGCGAKFKDGDPVIENQEMGRVEHDNPADYYNTCLKMAKKRSLVDATLTATAASDIFTQDIEDMPRPDSGDSKPKEKKEKKEKTENFNFLKVVGELKKKVGEDVYYEIIGKIGYEHADQITKRVEQELFYQRLQIEAEKVDQSEIPFPTEE